jgi:hypothetical protein
MRAELRNEIAAAGKRTPIECEAGSPRPVGTRPAKRRQAKAPIKPKVTTKADRETNAPSRRLQRAIEELVERLVLFQLLLNLGESTKAGQSWLAVHGEGYW